MCILFCVVYYLKATFGPGTGEAVLEIPVSVSDSGMCLSFMYRISSPRIELVVLKSKTGKTEASYMQRLKYTDQKDIGKWNGEELELDFDTEAIHLVAKKTGCTTNVAYVLVDDIEIDHCMYGNGPPFNFSSLSVLVCGLFRDLN